MKYLFLSFLGCLFILLAAVCSWAQTQTILPTALPQVKPIPTEHDIVKDAGNNNYVMGMPDSLYILKASHDVRYHNKIYDWQLTETIIIFWLVLFLVMVGIIFSGIQFYFSIKYMDILEDKAGTEVEVSLRSVKIKSTILGVIILFLSFAFFLSYLLYVYKIQ